MMVFAIMISNQCNFHCGHCMVDSTHEFSLISDEITQRYLEILSNGEADSAYILGGEPILHIDYVEKLVAQIKKYCREIVIFTNGSFLVNPKLAERVKNLNVTIRISNDKYHRKFWDDNLEEAIMKSGYVIETRPDDYEMIPVGRAYEEYKHLQYNMGCSLINGWYDERYPNNHRYMVMPDGRVNLYCAAIEASLANVFEDDGINYEMLVKREKILHEYLYKEVIKRKEDTYLAVMCNNCSQYKVTENHIYFKGRQVADTASYI